MCANFCLNLTISFGVMSVTESPTSKKWGDSSNDQSFQIGNISGQMLKRNVAFIHFRSSIHDFVQLHQKGRQISILRAKANIFG